MKAFLMVLAAMLSLSACGDVPFQEGVYAVELTTTVEGCPFPDVHHQLWELVQFGDWWGIKFPEDSSDDLPPGQRAPNYPENDLDFKGFRMRSPYMSKGILVVHLEPWEWGFHGTAKTLYGGTCHKEWEIYATHQEGTSWRPVGR